MCKGIMSLLCLLDINLKWLLHEELPLFNNSKLCLVKLSNQEATSTIEGDIPTHTKLGREHHHDYETEPIVP